MLSHCRLANPITAFSTWIQSFRMSSLAMFARRMTSTESPCWKINAVLQLDPRHLFQDLLPCLICSK